MRAGIQRKRHQMLPDYTEVLVCRAFGLLRLKDNTTGRDAVDPCTGERYEIKGSRPSGNNPLSSKINTEEHPFDFLVMVVFGDDVEVRYAGKFPYCIVKKRLNRSSQFAFPERLLDELSDVVVDVSELIATTHRKLGQTRLPSAVISP